MMFCETLQMGSFKVHLRVLCLYMLLSGLVLQFTKGETSQDESDQPSNESAQILQYHKSNEENFYEEETTLSSLFADVATPSVTNTSDSVLSKEFKSNTQPTLNSIKKTTTTNERTTNQVLLSRSTTPSIPSELDDRAGLSSIKANGSNQANDPRQNENTEGVYQWSLENEQFAKHMEDAFHQAEEVYYSVIPEPREPSSKFYDSSIDFSRELRSIAEDELESFAFSPSTTTTTSDLINPTPVASSSVLTSPQYDITSSEFANTASLLHLASHKKNNKIDDIIDGLVHLLGDNVKVANSTSRTLAKHSESYTVVSTRINNRGPPSLINSLSLLTEIPEPTVTKIETDTFTTSSEVESVTPTATVEESETFTSSNIDAATSKESTTSSSVITEHVPFKETTTSRKVDVIPSEIKITPALSLQTTQSAITTSTSAKDRASGTHPTEIYSQSSFNPAWRPVQQITYSNPNPKPSKQELFFPPTETNTKLGQVSALSLDKQPQTTKIQSTVYDTDFQPLYPSFYNPDHYVNKPTLHHTTIRTNIYSEPTEELSLITANEDTFGDIVLTATGVMNGGIKPPSVIPAKTQEVTSSIEESVFIDGRRQYFTLQNPDEESAIGVVENQPRPRPQTPASTRPRPQGFKPKPPIATTTKATLNKNKNSTPTIRIDTCIVGDDTACDSKNHEVCRTEGGVSSCSCPPGLARAKNSNECIAVVSLLLYMRIDHINGQRIFYNQVYSVDSPEKEYMKNEAVQGITSLFRVSSLAPIFVGLHFNTFYSIGAKLAVNLTIMIQDSPHTSNQLIKNVISRELVSTLQQRNHSIGNSHLTVDSLLNPIPAIHDVNECTDSDWNDCSANSDCENVFGSFKCNCWPGFTDKYSHDPLRRGRVCTACSPEYCNNHGICILHEGKQECRCRGSYIGSKCEIDSEVLGVALGASLAALLIIILTFICLCMWSRRWKKDHQKPQIHSASPSFTYMDKTGKAQCDLHALVSDNTLQWFPMRDTHARGNYYSAEPPELSRSALALVSSSNGPYSTIMRSNDLSHSQTKLMGSDDCISENQARFYVPRPKARSRAEYQNIYSDLVHEEEFTSPSRYHRNPYDGPHLHPFYN